MSERTVFDRIGGQAAVDATIQIFYDKILADPFLKPLFDGVDMAKQRRSQVAFVTYALGGPNQYSGRSLSRAHERLVNERGLNDAHFDAVAGHLIASLKELSVPQNLIDEVIAIVGSTRDAVLGRAA